MLCIDYIIMSNAEDIVVAFMVIKNESAQENDQDLR